MIRLRSLAPALAATCLVLAAPAGAAVIHPNITTDVVDPNDGKCSLREAVSSANNNAFSGLPNGECQAGDPATTATDTISLDATTYTLSLDTPASGTESANAEDDLNIKESVALKGQGPNATTIDAGGNDYRAIEITSAFPNPAPSVTIDGLKITRGRVTVTDFIAGGVLLNQGDLTLKNCAFVDNRGLDGAPGTSASPTGGEGAGSAALFAAGGTLTIDGCRFEDNHAGNGGPGFDQTGSNTGGNGGTGGDAGAVRIHNNGPNVIKNSLFVDNAAGTGGTGGAGGPGGTANGGVGGTGGRGGAVFSSINITSGTSIVDTTFRNNRGGTGGTGGAASTAGGRNGTGGTGGADGVIHWIGNMNLLRTRFESNSAGDGGNSGNGSGATQAGTGGAGGGIALFESVTGALTVKDVVADGNSAGDGGTGFGPSGGAGGSGGGAGGFLVQVPASFENTTLSGNRGGDGAAPTGSSGFNPGNGGPGGAIYISGQDPVTLLNSTLSGNRGGRGADWNFHSHFPGGAGGRGGGIYLPGAAPVTATHVTIAGNKSGQTGANPGVTAPFGDPIPAADNPGGAITTGSGTVSLKSSVLASNGPFACSGSISASDTDTIAYEPSNPSCPGKNVDPLLGDLADNGGFTKTRALGAGSPAIDFAASGACPATDQRGTTRPQGPGCDAGAFEREFVAPPNEPPTTPPTEPPTGPPAGPPKDRSRPIVGLFLLHPHLGRALKVGYATKFNSNEKGTVLVEVFVGKRRIARGFKTLTKTGKQTVYARFTSSARKKYRRTHRLVVTIRVTVTDAAGNNTVKEKKLTLKS